MRSLDIAIQSPPDSAAEAAGESLSRLLRTLLPILLLVCPLIVYGVLIGGMSLRLSRLVILTLTPLALMALALRPRLVLRDRFLCAALLPYFLYTATSALWSQNVETGTTTSRLGGLIEVILLYLILLACELKEHRFRRFVRWYVAAAVLPTIVAIWQLANNFLQFNPHEIPFTNWVIEGKYEEAAAGRYFVASGGFSRLSGTFAEPVIFSSYMVTVFALSLLLCPRNPLVRWMLILFRGVILCIILLALSKLSLLLLFIATIWLSWRSQKLRYGLILIAILFAVAFAFFASEGQSDIFSRLTSETGHLERLMADLDSFRLQSVTFGEGIGSLPYGSYHRMILSRVFESGIVGFFFTAAVTFLPIWMIVRRPLDPESEVTWRTVAVVLLVTVLGLHLYDYFIHIFSWTILGASVSFSSTVRSRLKTGWRRVAGGKP